MHISQQHLIKQIIQQTFKCNTQSRATLAKASEILEYNSGAEATEAEFNYKSVIGKLNYLKRGTRSNIVYTTYQYVYFVAQPKENHFKIVRWLA